MKRKAVFLDRDGVINRTIFWQGKWRAPLQLSDFEYFEGVKSAVQKLKDQNFLIIVVTNQPDVARGWQTRAMVETLNQKVKDDLAVDAIEVCYHVAEDACACRKPRPGMLITAAHTWNIDLAQSFLIGDRYSDIAAGISAGCSAILIGEGDASEKNFRQCTPAFRASALLEAAEWILHEVG
jgi:D-glycero-D-manno-heptose 1,7-bisphosphate phosphatase